MNYVALDLDRVLFDTDTFSQDITELTASLCGVSVEQFRVDSQTYRILGKHGLRHYDYTAQLASYRQPVQTVYSQVLDLMIKSAKTYVYPDVAGVLEQMHENGDNAFILSYGDDSYQRLKVKISPQLYDLKSHIVLQPKAEFITSHLPQSTGVLFDDTAQKSLPGGWEHVFVDRVAHPEDALQQAVMQWRQK